MIVGKEEKFKKELMMVRIRKGNCYRFSSVRNSRISIQKIYIEMFIAYLFRVSRNWKQTVHLFLNN